MTPLTQIPGFSNYSITTGGEVWNTNKKVPKQLKLCKNNRYVSVTLRSGFEKHSVGLHRLLALTFIPNPHNLPIVRHLNDNKHDNRIENLAWGTPKDNGRDARQNEKYPKGVDMYCAKLTEEIVREIRTRPKGPTLIVDLKNEFGVGYTTIQRALDGITWKHI